MVASMEYILGDDRICLSLRYVVSPGSFRHDRNDFELQGWHQM
jgi:hypothetical protein